MSVIWPMLLIGMSEMSIDPSAPPEAMEPASFGALFLVVVFVSQWIWLLARYVATAHGFRSSWGAVGIILGLSMLFSSLFLMVAGG